MSESCNPAVVASRDARGSLFLLRGRAGQKKAFRAGQRVNSSGRGEVTVKLGAVLKIVGAGAILDAQSHYVGTFFILLC